MTAEAQLIVEHVLSLPTSTREEVLTELIKSLDAEPSPTPEEQAAVDADWKTEIARRAREVQLGEAELLDGDEALTNLRNKFGV